MRTILTIALGVMLTGCAMFPTRYYRAQYVDLGMTREQVQEAAGGLPAKTRWSDGTECWDYLDGSLIWFERGVVSGWSY